MCTYIMVIRVDFLVWSLPSVSFIDLDGFMKAVALYMMFLSFAICNKSTKSGRKCGLQWSLGNC